MFAASRWLRTPKTPHSSLNLSNMRRRCCGTESSAAEIRDSGQDREPLGAGGGSEVAVEGDEGEGGGASFAGNDCGGELKCVRRAQRMARKDIERDLTNRVEVAHIAPC